MHRAPSLKGNPILEEIIYLRMDNIFSPLDILNYMTYAIKKEVMKRVEQIKPLQASKNTTIVKLPINKENQIF